MEAFSDGVFAVIITIHGAGDEVSQGTVCGLQPLLPVFFSYVLSFVYVGSTENHHHLLQAAKHVTGGILWANLHCVWSRDPFVTPGWGRTFCALAGGVIRRGVTVRRTAYFLLTKTLIAHHGKDSTWRIY